MKLKLLATLVEKMQEFIESDEFCDEADFFVGEQTAILLAKGAEAVYDGMENAVRLEESKGEE